jgi:phospholipid/cholesterol/gamma-HCH transport system substrate-binding protein
LKLSKEFKIGVFTIIAGILLFVGFQYLKGFDMSKPNKEYVVYYDHIAGLTPSNPVTYRGLKIGSVKTIEFVGDNSDSVKVVVLIDDDQFEMKQNTIAKLGSDGLLGGMKIELEYVNIHAKELKQGGILLSEREKDLTAKVNDQLLPLKIKAEGLIGTIDTMVTTLNALIGGSISSDMEASFAGVKRAILQFERTAIKIDTLVSSERYKISSILNNVNAITSNLSDNEENITNTLNNTSTFSDELKKVELEKTLRQAEETFTKLNLIMSQINSGEGTLGSLIYNDSLHSAILETNAYVKLLVDDIRNFPSRYLHFSVFGSRSKGPVKLDSKQTKELKKLLDDNTNGDIRRFTNAEMDSLRTLIYGN